MTEAKRAVVLLSGGVDSATCLAIARNQGFECHALTVIYGQRHLIEVESSRMVAASLGAREHRFVRVELDQIGGSALTDQIDVPKSGDAEGIPVTYVPARNTVFLSIALGLAEVLTANAIFIGANAVDYSGYPDCRPEFIAAFEALANLATKAGVEGRRIQVHAPLIDLPKTEIIRVGLALGVEYGITFSCYDPSPDGKPCGECDSCRIRRRAFADLGMADPATRPLP